MLIDFISYREHPQTSQIRIFLVIGVVMLETGLQAQLTRCANNMFQGIQVMYQESQVRIYTLNHMLNVQQQQLETDTLKAMMFNQEFVTCLRLRRNTTPKISEDSVCTNLSKF